MKRSTWAAAAAALVITIGTIGAALPAAAAPPTAAWSGSAGGDVASVTASAVGLNVTDLGVAVSAAQASSTATPRAVSSSSNISAEVVGLPIGISTNSVSAPPDAGPEAGGIGATVTGLIDVGAITTLNEAHWGLDTACVTDGVLSSATTQTASLGVLPLLNGGVLSLGVSQTTGQTGLTLNDGANYGVQSVASGTITGLSILGGAVTVTVAGSTTLTATATGTSTGTVAYAPATVTVTSAGGSVVLTTAAPTTTVNVLGVGDVTVGLNTPTFTTTATSASASVALLTVGVRLPAAPLPALTDVSVDVLPLTASATAPTGGIDCPPPAPLITTPAAGSTTADSTPAIGGTALPGATVTVTLDGSPLATPATADIDGNWSLVAPVLADGPHIVSATQTVNGQTGPASADVPFTVDTTAPVAPVVVTPANGSTTADNTPTITGTAVPGSTVTVSIDGSPLATTATADVGGNWTLDAPVLADGSHTVNAVAADAVGNTSPVSNTNTFIVDTTAPAAPVVLTPANGSVTADNTPTVTGTAVPGSTITISIDGSPLGTTTTADVDGNWSLVAPVLADGSHTVNAVAADAVGNTSPASNTNTFTVDTTAPAAPAVLTPANGSATADNTPTITGTAVAGSTVTVSIDGNPLATTATADAGGAWSLTAPALADGSHTVNAVAADAVGNTSPVSNTNTFIVDTAAPAAPIIESPVTGDVLDDATPDISGIAEADSIVTVIIDGTPAGTTTASDTGAWTFTPPTPLAEGEHTAVATATDAAGNVSPESNEVTFTVDTVAPPAPVITSPSTGDLLSDATPEIAGTAEANAVVTVIIDGTEAGTTTADDIGAWTFTPPTPLADGEHTVVATATDAAGNVSPESNEVTFTIDATAPAAPVIESPDDGDVVDTATPLITGTAVANSTVTVIIDGTEAGTTTADDTGAWTFTPPGPLAEGEHTVVATATDAAGNVSPESNEVTFTIDTIAPPAPVITAPADGSTVADDTPAITGTAEPGSTVTVIIDGAPVGTTTADDTGAWIFTPTTPLADGEHTVTATATDEVGHISPESAEISFTVDTTPPAAPIITSPADGSTTGDTTPPVTGTAEPDSTVSVIIDGVVVGIAPADDDGAWTFTPTTPLPAGDHTITATATDAAGNVGPASAPVTVTIEQLTPGPPAAPPADGGLAATGATTPFAVALLGGILVALGLLTFRSRRRLS
jgi:hypothetical protein